MYFKQQVTLFQLSSGFWTWSATYFKILCKLSSPKTTVMPFDMKQSDQGWCVMYKTPFLEWMLPRNWGREHLIQTVLDFYWTGFLLKGNFDLSLDNSWNLLFLMYPDQLISRAPNQQRNVSLLVTVLGTLEMFLAAILSKYFYKDCVSWQWLEQVTENQNPWILFPILPLTQ